MTKTKFLLTTIAVLLCSVMANAHDFEVDGIYYNIISSDAVEVTFKGAKEDSYDNEYMYRLVIPSTVTYEENVYRVTRIGSNAFSYCTSLTSVVIPEGVTSIKSFAFYYCSNLNEITIPKSVTTIDYKAFDSAGNIKDIHIGSVESWLNIGFDESGARPNRTSSSFNLYLNDKLITNLEIPASINTIPEVAFAGCISLLSITLHEDITSIGDYAFYGCEDLSKVINYSNLSLSAGMGSHGCVALYAKIIITGSELTTIDNFQFRTSDSVHQLINYIGNDTIIVLPNKFNGENYAIGDGAFMGCSSIKSIRIPKCVTSIGNYAFDNCTSLEEIIFEDSEETLSIGYNKNSGVGEGLFYDCPLKLLYIGRNLKQPRYNGSYYNGYSPFYNKTEIASITISNCVTSINSYMFYGCSTLPNISIPNSIETIGDHAFYGCSSLREIIIPNSVTDIGKYAFDECPNIRLLVIGTGLLSIGAGQSQPTKAVWLTNTPPSGHHYFGGTINYVPNEQYWFSKGSYSLTRYVYPYLSSMFEVDGLKYVPISPSERTCDIIDCVYDSTMAQITINPTVSYQGIDMTVKKITPYAFYQNDYIKELSITNQGDIESSAFYRCKNIETLFVSNLGHIGNSAFAGCTNLKTLIISNQGHVYSNAFSNCSNLKTATISNNGNIESQAFYKCVGLEQVDISNQGYIGTQAFYECTNLKIANINNAYAKYTPGVPVKLDDLSVYHSSKSQSYSFRSEEGGVLSFSWFVSDGTLEVYLDSTCILSKSDAKDNYVSKNGDYENILYPGEHTLEIVMLGSNGSISVSDFMIDYSDGMNVGAVRGEAFYGCSALQTIRLGEEIGALADKVFYQCYSLQEIIIPDSIKSVGKCCFGGCSALKSAMIGDGLAAIKDYTFQDCSALESVIIGNHVTSIDSFAFVNCSSLVEIELGDNTSVINNNAFENCTSLSTISIPHMVSNIEDNAFKGCASLEDVIIEDRSTKLKLGSNGSSPLFADCPLDSVYIGGKITYNTSQKSGYSPFYRNTSLRTITITDQEDQIYENEFYGCTNLKNVTIGHGIKNIGNRAFSGCSSLDKFSFGSNVESIGEEAFSDCTKMTELTSYSVLPPICGANALDDINKWSCVLKVPQNYKPAYQAADQWKEFFFIEDVVEVKKYAVTYMVDNEIFATDSLAVGESIVPIAEPSKEGYTFSGWSNIPEAMPAEDITITGTFTVNTYTITYMVDEEIFATDTVAYGDTIVLIAEPSKEGYTFSGWSEVPEIMPAEDLVVIGSFVRNTYTITYVVDSVVYATDSITYGDTIALLDEPIQEGYTFSGWSEVPKTMPAEDLVVTGSFVRNTYTITYVVDNVFYATDSITYGDTIALPDEPTQEGYTFSGWSDAPVTMPAEDIIIEGSFNVNYYALKYIVDNEPFATDSLAYGDTIILREEPQKEDFEFSGWSEVPETMPAHDVEVYGNFIFTSVTDVKVDSEQSQKVVEDNQLFIILPNGKKYNVTGQEIGN